MKTVPEWLTEMKALCVAREPETCAQRRVRLALAQSVRIIAALSDHAQQLRQAQSVDMGGKENPYCRTLTDEIAEKIINEKKE